MKVLKIVKDIQEGRLQTTAQKKRSIHAHKMELKMLWKDGDVNVSLPTLSCFFE